MQVDVNDITRASYIPAFATEFLLHEGRVCLLSAIKGSKDREERAHKINVLQPRSRAEKRVGRAPLTFELRA